MFRSRIPFFVFVWLPFHSRVYLHGNSKLAKLSRLSSIRLFNHNSTKLDIWPPDWVTMSIDFDEKKDRLILITALCWFFFFNQFIEHSLFEWYSRLWYWSPINGEILIFFLLQIACNCAWCSIIRLDLEGKPFFSQLHSTKKPKPIGSFTRLESTESIGANSLH